MISTLEKAGTLISGQSEPGTSDAAARTDRGTGALLGLAVGDALGTTLEFSPRDAAPLHTEMMGGGPFRLQAGQWTDDTSMAIALGDSFLSQGCFDPNDLMERFLAWYETGRYSCTGTCFDIGITTRRALERFKATGNPFAGSENPREAGNGSLMRVAPVALFALHDHPLASRLARDQSRTTHAAAEAVEACDFFVQLLRQAILGAGVTVFEPHAWNGTSAISAIAAGAWKNKGREEISASGYVVSTLEAALWSVFRSSNFEEALVLAVNLGEDADTVGAVTGQLAGAIYGAQAIPSRWVVPLAWRERIEEMAVSLPARSRRDDLAVS